MADTVEKEIFWVQSAWVVANESAVRTDESGDRILVDETAIVHFKDERRRAVLVCSDSDLAARYIAKHGGPGLVPVSFKSREHFAAFLQRASDAVVRMCVLTQKENRISLVADSPSSAGRLEQYRLIRFSRASPREDGLSQKNKGTRK